ncbi:hypothetical protein [Elioraea sp.]|uniref:hypothetical protein n=1 Tax=Elioraea sp. TaxID=2185103 RepID=UPI003F6FCB77
MESAEEHCPPPAGLTVPGLLTLLGLGPRGDALRRRLARALHDRAPAQFPAEEDRTAFGRRLLGLLATAEGDAAFQEAAVVAEADIAPSERQLDLLAAARQIAGRALDEAAPDAAARLRSQHLPGAPPALALAAASADAALWTEAALILWRLAALPSQAEGAARLAARYPALADALPTLARRGTPEAVPGPARQRDRLLRLMGLAEDPDTAMLLPPPGAHVESKLAALPAERIASLPDGWRETLHRSSGRQAGRINDALAAFERASLTVEARETALREAALQAELDLVAIEAALTAARQADAARDHAWRTLVQAIAAAQ